MTLKDCTKEELIFVIKRLQFYSLSNDHCVQRALGDVEEEREARKLREARRLSALQNQKMQEYISLMRPYEGISLMDVPEVVLDRADAAMKESHPADMKWRKLMGIHTSKPSAKKDGEKHMKRLTMKDVYAMNMSELALKKRRSG